MLEFVPPLKHWNLALTKLSLLLSKLNPGECRTSEELCKKILQFAIDQPNWCFLGQAWSVDPRSRRLILVAQCSRMLATPEFPAIITRDDTLIGEAVQTRQPKLFAMPTEGGKFEFQEQLIGTGVKDLLAVPIRNTGNPHQVLFVFVFYLIDRPSPLQLEKLVDLSRQVAVQLQTHLRERTYRLATRLSCNLVSDEGLRSDEAYSKLGSAIVDAIEADMATVYIQTWNQKTLERRCTISRADPTSLIKSGNEAVVPFVVKDVWESNRELLLWPQSGTFPVNNVFEDDRPIPFSVMLVPIRNLKGAAVGVVRCVKENPRNGLPFTYDDVAIAYALGHSFGPPLEMLLSATQTEISLSKLCHELRIPVFAFGAAIERMEWESKQDDYSFRHAYYEDVHIFVDMMNRLLIEVDIIRKGFDGIKLESKRTNIGRSIIHPAKRHIGPVLRKYGFRPHQLRFDGFDDLPWIRVDQSMIYQVVFNMVENAIKFYKGAPESFLCEIKAVITPTWFEIIFRDNGPGISDSDRNRIFEFQGRGASTSDISGSGLGLWISETISRKHGGTLCLKNSRNPTEFLLRLPRSLQADQK